MFKKFLAVAVLVLPSLVFAAGYTGKETVKSGFLLGIKPCVCFPVSDDMEGLSSGMGFDLHLGYRFPQNVSIQGSYLFSMHTVSVGSLSESWGWGGLLLDIRYYIPIIEACQVYIVVGTGSYALVNEDSDGFAGFGFNFGAGADYWINKNISVGPELIFHTPSYSTVIFNGTSYSLDPKANGNTFAIAISANYQF